MHSSSSSSAQTGRYINCTRRDVIKIISSNVHPCDADVSDDYCVAEIAHAFDALCFGVSTCYILQQLYKALGDTGVSDVDA